MSRAGRLRSPWIDELEPDPPPRPLTADITTDVAIIGAGIAGVSTAFFALRDTSCRVLLIERDRVGRGATGHNAGQLTTYFERPLCDLVDAYGFEAAIAAQRAIDDTWALLDLMVAESGADVAIERCVSHMGMFSLDHLRVHLRNSALRRAGGLRVPDCLIADDAPFLRDIPAEHAELYDVVPADRIRQVLGTGDHRYCAVLSDLKGCANGALLSQEVVRYLAAVHPDRFEFVDHTPVERVVLDDGSATVHAGGRRVTASRVVLCTNGFVDHLVEDRSGGHVAPAIRHRVAGDVGYMAAFVEPTIAETRAISFIRNEQIGGDTPYVYMTARPHDGAAGRGTLVCIGGPEEILDDPTHYSPAAWHFPDRVIAEIDTEILPMVHPARPPGLEYDYTWHGLMGYTESRVRLIGVEPANPVLTYNLGCNGVGFLPSIFGGWRVAQIIAGRDVEPMIFDPPS